MFIRGDVELQEFEKWFYSQQNLEEIFGKEFYLDFILAKVNSLSEIHNAKKKLVEKMDELFPRYCECLLLSDDNVTHMGSELDEKVFATLDKIKSYGQSKWWLDYFKCKICNQPWLVAEDQRINDVNYLKRITTSDEEGIINNNAWPPYFQTYAELFKIAKKYNIKVRWLDHASSLEWAVEDMIAENKHITVKEIAYLLDIKIKLAKKIYKKFDDSNSVCNTLGKLYQYIKRIFCR